MRTFPYGVSAIHLIDYSQTELRISAPSVGQACRVSNIKVHRQKVYVVSLRKYEHTPIGKQLTMTREQPKNIWEWSVGIPFVSARNKNLRVMLLRVQPGEILNSPGEFKRRRILHYLVLYSTDILRLWTHHFRARHKERNHKMIRRQSRQMRAYSGTSHM